MCTKAEGEAHNGSATHGIYWAFQSEVDLHQKTCIHKLLWDVKITVFASDMHPYQGVGPGHHQACDRYCMWTKSNNLI